MDKVDFRSDTVSWPTPNMRQAMANATIGDDVYGEDPTINELESLAAAKVGMDARDFCLSLAWTLRLSETAKRQLRKLDASNAQTILRYLNRLSDLLFVIARVLARANGGKEVIWVHGDKRGKAEQP